MKKITLIFLLLFPATVFINAQNWAPANGHFPWIKYSSLICADGKILLGCDSGIVLSSHDHGDSWTIHRIPGCAKKVMTLAESGSGSIYAGTYGRGIFKSPGNFSAWTVCNTPDSIVRHLCISPNGSLLMTGQWSHQYAFSSADSATTWDTIITPSSYSPESISVSPVTGEIFIVTLGGYFVSTDTAQTWSALHPFTHNSYNIERLTNTDTLFMSTATQGCYRSVDNGLSWNQLSLSPNIATTLVKTTTDGKVFFNTPGGAEIKFSLDGGLTFSSDEISTQANDLSYDPATGFLYVATNNTDGSFRFDFSGTTPYPDYDIKWQNMGITVSGACVYASPRDSLMLAGNFDYTVPNIFGGIYRSADNGHNWNRVSGTDGLHATQFIRLNDNSLLACCSDALSPLYSGIFRSTDNGITWTQSGLANSFFKSIIQLPSGKILVSSSNNGLYKSTDEGITFQQVSSVYMASMYYNETTGVLIGKNGSTQTIVHSSNEGQTWTNSVSGNMFVVFNPITGSSFYAGLNDDLHRSTDDAVTWNLYGSGLPPYTTAYAKNILVTPCGDMYITLSNWNVYVSSDDGATWTLHSSSLPYFASASMMSSFNTMFGLGGAGDIVYRYNIPFSISPSSCRYVWPGDANDDRNADMNDLFSVGLYYSQTGTPRATISNAWSAQPSSSWNTLQYNGADLKHADCNGDGIIDAADTVAISQNYGLFHIYRMGRMQPEISGLPLYLKRTCADTILAGDTATFDVILGSNAQPASFYGGNYRVDYDTSLVLQNSSAVFIPQQNFPAWLTLHPAAAQTFISGALVRKDQVDTTGVITIGQVHFPTKNSISSYVDFAPGFYHWQFIDHSGHEIAVLTMADSLIIKPLNTGIAPAADKSYRMSVFPNPATNNFSISLQFPVATSGYLDIRDLTGQIVYSAPLNSTENNNRFSFNAGMLHLPSGYYIVTFESSGVKLSQKLVIAKSE